VEDRFKNLRNQAARIVTILVVCIILFSIGLYDFAYAHVEGVRSFVYWRFMFGLPTTVNLMIIAAMWFILESPNIKAKVKNITVMYVMLLVCFVTITVFQRFSASFAMYGIPVLFSAVFVDKKIARMTAANAFFFNFLSYGIGKLYTEPYQCPDAEICFVISTTCIAISCVLSIVLFHAMQDNLAALNAGAANNESLEKKLEKDPMTGLYNHSAFYTHLDRLVKERNDAPLSLAVVDIDNFKRINDTYGHNNGDEVILRLTHIMRERCEDGNNCVCRYGGEEFAVIFPNVKVKQAKEIMDGVLQEFREQRYDWLEGNVTFSCGIFQLSAYRMSSTEFFRVADKMLYQAKHSGKNQCVSG